MAIVSSKDSDSISILVSGVASQETEQAVSYLNPTPKTSPPGSHMINVDSSKSRQGVTGLTELETSIPSGKYYNWVKINNVLKYF